MPNKEIKIVNVFYIYFSFKAIKSDQNAIKKNCLPENCTHIKVSEQFFKQIK